MSVRASTGSPRTCSGDMYPGVPSTAPGRVPSPSGVSVVSLRFLLPSMPLGAVNFAMPKSSELCSPPGGEEDVLRFHVPVDDATRVSRRQALGNLHSEFQRASAAAADPGRGDAAAILPPAARSPGKERHLRSRRRARPPGWDGSTSRRDGPPARSVAAARDSSAAPSEMTLSATSRPSRVWQGRDTTSPIPPAPRAARTSCGPTRAPAASRTHPPGSESHAAAGAHLRRSDTGTNVTNNPSISETADALGHHLRLTSRVRENRGMGDSVVRLSTGLMNPHCRHSPGLEPRAPTERNPWRSVRNDLLTPPPKRIQPAQDSATTRGHEGG